MIEEDIQKAYPMSIMIYLWKILPEFALKMRCRSLPIDLHPLQLRDVGGFGLVGRELARVALNL
jgi:hypothetical protein